LAVIEFFVGLIFNEMVFDVFDKFNLFIQIHRPIRFLSLAVKLSRRF
jgi:hypothetical protein